MQMIAWHLGINFSNEPNEIESLMQQMRAINTFKAAEVVRVVEINDSCVKIGIRLVDKHFLCRH